MDATIQKAVHLLVENHQPQATEYCLLWVNWWATCLTKSEWASWVQAIGSILAIGAAASIAAWQGIAARRDEERRRREQRLERAQTIKHVLRRISLIVDNAARAWDGSQHARKIALEQVAIAQAGLRSIPIFELPSPELVFQLQRVDRDLMYVTAFVNQAAARVAAGKGSGIRFFRRIYNRLNLALVHCELLIDANGNGEPDSLQNWTPRPLR